MRLWSFEMGEKSVYGGKGVVKAVENINNLLAPELLGFDTRSVSQSVRICARIHTRSFFKI
jgi:enolase